MWYSITSQLLGVGDFEYNSAGMTCLHVSSNNFLIITSGPLPVEVRTGGKFGSFEIQERRQAYSTCPSNDDTESTTSDHPSLSSSVASCTFHIKLGTTAINASRSSLSTFVIQQRRHVSIPTLFLARYFSAVASRGGCEPISSTTQYRS
ncbi:unnamed protein product [Somion occarium]|uniref:Uncharacterized protein n=1 Tax=Somion occarium TaxID=3059160 RepID=A0ABP1E2D0_9APHY